MSTGAPHPCLCSCHHPGGGGVPFCEHCAPAYFARRHAIAEQNFVRRNTADRATAHITPNTAGGHSADQRALA